MAAVLFKRGRGYEEKCVRGVVVGLRATQDKCGNKDWRAGCKQTDRHLKGTERGHGFTHKSSPQNTELSRDWYKAEHPNRLTHPCAHTGTHAHS